MTTTGNATMLASGPRHEGTGSFKEERSPNSAPPLAKLVLAAIAFATGATAAAGFAETLETRQEPATNLPSSPLFRYSQASFTRITVEEGLSANTIRSVVQDDKGFIWIATQDGLNRYDGYELEIFRHDPDDPASLSANGINDLAYLAGRVWIATDKGLDSVIPATGEISHHRLFETPGTNSIDVLAVDGKDKLWIGTSDGIFRMDVSSDQPAQRVGKNWQPFVTALAAAADGVLVGTDAGLFRIDRKRSEISSSLLPEAGLSVDSIWIDKGPGDQAQAVWAGTSEGLFKVARDGKVLSHYQNVVDDPASLSSNEVNTVIRDTNGVLWAGTRNGLNKLDESSGRFQRFYNVPADPKSLSSSIVYDLFEDDSGLLWVGGYYGLNIKRQRGTEIGLLNHNPESANTLADGNVFSINEDETGHYWIGSASGITVVDPRNGNFRQLSPLPGTQDRPPYVITLEKDRKGNIWAGTVFNGLYRIDARTFDAAPVPLPLEEDLSPPFVTQVLEDDKGNLWVAHHGLFLLRAGQVNNWERVPLELSQEAKRHAMHLAADSKGNIWVGSNDGVARISLDDTSGMKAITWFRATNPDATHGLKHADILSLLVDDKDRLWVGSDGSGLGLLENSSRADPRSSKFSYINMTDGLLNDTVYAILDDKDGNLWLTTNRGLTRLDPQSMNLRHYGPGQGVQGLEFNEFSAYKSEDGLMMFGGPAGITFFEPGQLEPSDGGPPVHITGISVAGQDTPVPENGALELGYKDFIFTVQFVALNYANPQASHYEYRLKGLSDEWIRLESSHEATFTNLDAGSYLLEIRAATNNGVWTDSPETLKIQVDPAPWKTPFAYTIYFILFLLSLYLAVYLRIRKHRLDAARERENSERLERLVNERTRELAQKSRALEEASVTDMLTKLHNRRYIYTRIEQDMAMIRRRHADKENFDADKNDLLFVMIDIDHFKQINDKYGHFAGDQVLVAVAAAIKNTCRGADSVVRWGGEEFLAVAMETDRSQADRIGERLHEALDNLEVKVEGGTRIRVTCSIGICPYPFDPRDWDTLSWEQTLGLADHAMYAVKRFGRNGWMVVDHDPAKEPVTLEIRRNSNLDLHASRGNVRISTSLAQVQIRWQPDRPDET